MLRTACLQRRSVLGLFPTNDNLVHLDVGQLLHERLDANLLGRRDACLVGVRVLCQKAVVVTLAVPAAFAGQVELGAGNQEYGEVALVGRNVAAGFHDSELALDQIFLEALHVAELHGRGARAAGEQQAVFVGELLDNRHNVRFARERVERCHLARFPVTLDGVDFFPRVSDKFFAVALFAQHLEKRPGAENQKE